MTIHSGCDCPRCRRHAAHVALGLVGRPITNAEWKAAEKLAGISEPVTVNSRPDVSGDAGVVAAAAKLAKAAEVFDAARLVWLEVLTERSTAEMVSAESRDDDIRARAMRSLPGIAARLQVAQDAMDAANRPVVQARSALAAAETAARLRAT